MNLLPHSPAALLAAPAGRWDHTPRSPRKQGTSSSPVPSQAPENVLRLVEYIYQAVQDASLWTNVLQAIATAVHADTAILAAPLAEHPVLVGGVQAASWKALLRERISAERPEYGRELAFGRDFSRPAEEDATERMTVECDLPSVRQTLHAMGQNLGGHGAPYMMVVRRKDAGAFGQSAQRVFATLLPHLANAFSLQLRLAHAQAQVHGAQAALNAFDHAILRLDRKGRVHFMSYAAETLLRGTPEMQVKDNSLHMATPALQDAFKAAMQSVTASSPQSRSCQSFRLRRSDESSLQIPLLLFPSLSFTSAEIMVLLTDPRHGSGARTKTLRELYQLSPAEARVADLLAQGLTVREVADQLKLNLETVRFHVKRLLAKTGSRRQAELMKLMLSLPSL